MHDEHAITYKTKVGMAELDYLIKKANRHGLNGKWVSRVYQEEDEEGFHVYFEVKNLNG